MEIISGLIIVFAAGFIQGLTSFGFALISVPLLLRLFPLNETVPIIVVLCFLTNILVLYNCIKEVKIKKIWLLIISSLLFAPLGVYSLQTINSEYLKIFCGIIIIIFSLFLILKKSFPIKMEKLGYVIAGSASGFLNGSLSLSGPPVVLFLSNQGINKEGFRANITFSALVLNLITIITYLINGLLTRAVFGKILYLIPAMVLGVFIGIKLCKKLDELLFKRITLVLLIISGTWTIASAIMN
ncbi:MAG: sulfite exporter TauE/SafE family protein [Treponema sp.]|nr:sulfite exporter TauE/SafE family protein [Treponema sp.]